MNKMTGGCLCGNVRYEVLGKLRQVIACHCIQCRKTSGHYVAATACNTQDLHIFGEVTWYRSSKSARRGFCPICGSNLFWRPVDGTTTSIFAGTLNGETGLKTVEQIYTNCKGDYYELPDVPIGDAQESS